MGDKNENELVLFETEDNAVKLEVPFDSETVWLSANQWPYYLIETRKPLENM